MLIAIFGSLRGHGCPRMGRARDVRLPHLRGRLSAAGAGQPTDELGVSHDDLQDFCMTPHRGIFLLVPLIGYPCKGI